MFISLLLQAQASKSFSDKIVEVVQNPANYLVAIATAIIVWLLGLATEKVKAKSASALEQKKVDIKLASQLRESRNAKIIDAIGEFSVRAKNLCSQLDPTFEGGLTLAWMPHTQALNHASENAKARAAESLRHVEEMNEFVNFKGFILGSELVLHWEKYYRALFALADHLNQANQADLVSFALRKLLADFHDESHVLIEQAVGLVKGALPTTTQMNSAKNAGFQKVTTLLKEEVLKLQALQNPPPN